jgi:hypothetical protein
MAMARIRYAEMCVELARQLRNEADELLAESEAMLRRR